MRLLLVVALFSFAQNVLSLGGFGVKKVSPSTSTTSSISSYVPPSDAAPCPCTSSLNYENCCKPYHSQSTEESSPAGVIRARYSAYAMRNYEYIIDSTSTTSTDFEYYESTTPTKEKARRKWVKDLKFNFKDYHMVKMEIDCEEDIGDKESATVTYRQLAIRIADNVMFPTQETSHLVLSPANGEGKRQWRYVRGDVARPSSELASVMMETWPGLVGLELKPGMADVGTPKRNA